MSLKIFLMHTHGLAQQYGAQVLFYGCSPKCPKSKWAYFLLVLPTFCCFSSRFDDLVFHSLLHCNPVVRGPKI